MRPVARLTYANVVSTLCLVLIVGGGVAYAANTVFSADIVDGEVKGPDIAANAVGSGKIADRQVKNADLSIGASSSNTIADGGIQGVDVKSDTLTGDDIDQLSLDFECPPGYELAGKDVCYEPGPDSAAHTNANFDTALSTCAGNGDRLPTLAEGWAVLTDLPNPGDFAFEQTWTADQSNGTTNVTTLTKNFQGTITRGSTAATVSFPYRCVTSPHG
jgi:hypothetical protein